MTENLKLPICPRCNETKNIKSTEFKSTKLVPYGDYSYYSCPSCNIEWNYWDGIIDNNIKGDGSIHVFENPNPLNYKVGFYGWRETSVGVLDSRRLFAMPLVNFSDEEIKILEQEIEEYNDGQ